MKLKNILTLLLLSGGMLAAQAQTADEIIKKYDKAMGGVEAQKKIKTLHMEGVMKQQGMEFPMTIQIVNDKAMRVDIVIQGMTITQAYKDGSGWSINPLQGSTTASKMNEEELKGAEEQADIVSELADYKAKGNKVEYIGKEDVEGTDTYKLKLTKKNNDVEYYFLDAETYLPLKMTSTQKYGDKEVESETFFSDYKDVAGVKMAQTTQVKSGGQVVLETTFSKVEANAKIEDSVFEMPK